MRSTQYVQHNENWNTNNRSVEKKLMISVASELGRELTEADMRIIKRVLGNLFTKGYRDERELIRAGTVHAVHQISEILLRKDVDVHNVLRNIMNSEDNPEVRNPLENIVSSYRPQIEIAKIFDIKTGPDMAALIAPQTALKKATIVLDTRYRSLDTDGLSSFRWNMSNSILATPGTVNNTNIVRNLKVMRVYPLRIPYNQSADTYYGRISMHIVEFNSQAAILHEGGYMHFMFRPTRQGNFIELDQSYQNDGYFEFAIPITRIDTITIRFGDPVQPLIFTADRAIVSILTYGTETIMRTAVNHGLVTGDLVIFSDFATQNVNGDYVLINSINSENGISIDVSPSNVPNILTDFMIAIDTSILFATGAGTISVTINSPTITGTGTAFFSLFRANDIIVINGINYTISSISSDTNITLKTNYGGITASGVSYSKDNRILGLQFTCYFASKRFFIPLEFQYIDANIK